jgi:hypothetical protein
MLPYSPDLNPIKQASPKGRARKAETRSISAARAAAGDPFPGSTNEIATTRWNASSLFVLKRVSLEDLALMFSNSTLH